MLRACLQFFDSTVDSGASRGSVSPIIASVPLKFMKQNLPPLALLDPVDAVWERW